MVIYWYSQADALHESAVEYSELVQALHLLVVVQPYLTKTQRAREHRDYRDRQEPGD